MFFANCLGEGKRRETVEVQRQKERLSLVVSGPHFPLALDEGKIGVFQAGFHFHAAKKKGRRGGKRE